MKTKKQKTTVKADLCLLPTGRWVRVRDNAFVNDHGLLLTRCETKKNAWNFWLGSQHVCSVEDAYVRSVFAALGIPLSAKARKAKR